MRSLDVSHCCGNAPKDRVQFRGVVLTGIPTAVLVPDSWRQHQGNQHYILGCTQITLDRVIRTPTVLLSFSIGCLSTGKQPMFALALTRANRQLLHQSRTQVIDFFRSTSTQPKTGSIG